MSDTPIDILQIKIERARDALPRMTLNAINSVDWRAVILSMKEKKGYSFEQLEDLELETELVLCGLLNPAQYPKEIEKRLKIPKSQVDLLVQEMNEFVFKKIREELIKNSQRKEIFIKKESTDISSNVPTINRPTNIIETEKHILSPNIINAKENLQKLPQNSKEEGWVGLSKNTTIETMPAELKGNVLKVEPEKEKVAPIELKEEEKPEDSILSQKLSGSFQQLEQTKTEYSLNNLSNKNDFLEKTNVLRSNKVKNSKIDPYRIDPNE